MSSYFVLALLMVVAYFAGYYRIFAFCMPKCNFYFFSRRSTVIVEGGTFLQINVVPHDIAVLSDVETKDQFSFFKDCGNVVIFDGVFEQKNVSCNDY